MRAIELFSCAGGMAEGFRRAGLVFEHAFDYSVDACDSYEANHGHRPVQMDARDLVRMVRTGWSPGQVDLIVADPPCTPWSRAGKRQGLDDERDMLRETVELIGLVRPRAYLIGNVPGLDDAKNWPVVQEVLAPLAKLGYCIRDFAQLDAADYGVPQHRVRPFWYGHLEGPCVRWPKPTHGDVAVQVQLPELDELEPWVTCRQALQVLEPHELGRPVKLRWRGANGRRIASTPDMPARVVGTSNLSDGNVLAHPDVAVRKDGGRKHRHPGRKARASLLDEPAGVVTSRENQGDGSVLLVSGSLFAPGDVDQPSPTIRAAARGSQKLVAHKPSSPDAPARTLTRNTHSDGALLVHPKHPLSELDEPAYTIATKGSGQGAQGGAVLAVSPKHPASELDEPARTIRQRGDSRGASSGGAAIVVHPRHPVSESPDEPARTVTARPANGGSSGGAVVAQWPWDRPSTTVCTRDTIPPPGHHPEEGSILTMPGAILLSEKAAAILQGFPATWVFAGKTKKARWAQIGMAMPPGLASPVARAVLEQLAASSTTAERIARPRSRVAARARAPG